MTETPQQMFKMLRDAAPVVELDAGLVGDLGGRGMMIVGRDEDVRHVLSHPDVFSSGVDAVDIGQIRPLIPLQVDPPGHRAFRRLLDPIFAPRQVATIEHDLRSLVRVEVEAVADLRGCNFHESIAEPLPTTVFLQLLGLPVSRAAEFIELKNGIIRPQASPEQRHEAVANTGAKIYDVLREVVEDACSAPDIRLHLDVSRGRGGR